MRKSIKKFLNKTIVYHFLVITGFALFSVTFFYPVLSGKQILQSDIQQYSGMSRQIKDYRAKGEEIYWIDNAFGGMPTYQLGAKYPYDFLTPIHKIFQLIPQPAEILFLYLLCTYLFLLIIKMPIPIAILGSFAYALSTYLLIILQVGHNTKAQAIAYMPIVIGGLYMILNNKRLLGFILTVFSLSMQIRANHYQMTYYMLILMMIIFIFYGFKSFKDRSFKLFAKNSIILISSGLIALGLNAPPLLATSEYAKFSTRGETELKLDLDGTPKESTGGLSKDYITQFSYGIFETLNLIAPRIQGGGSTEDLGENSDIYEFLIENGVTVTQSKEFAANVPTYWGSQPILEAPAYVGISVIFLATIALFLVKSPLKNGLFLGVIISLLLSWGKNFPLLTNLFIDYFPLYNKFRAVSSIQVILEFCFPILACMGVYKVFEKKEKKNLQYILKISLGFISSLLIILFSAGFLDFSGPMDSYISEGYGPILMEQIVSARKQIYNYDLTRAIIYCLLISIVYLLFHFGKIGKTTAVISLIVIVLIDLIGISNRYIDREMFVSPRKKMTLFQPRSGDKTILKDNSRFRVFEPSLQLSGARTSYFHDAVGGYHGAKPRRFEELFDFFSSHQIQGVIDMLNVKYLLFEEANQQKIIENPTVLGNSWTVDSLIVVNSADELLKEMKTLNFSNQALVLKKEIPKNISYSFNSNALKEINLTSAKPTNLSYDFNASENQMVVFSEMYYPKGWVAEIDGEIVEHFPINYILRGMIVPKGKHKINFLFDPPVIKLGSIIRLLTLLLFFLILFYMFYVSNKKKPPKNS
tara:strand:+ start:4211 stop:6646 length:2436 start_codon:yes stop_codon:yes gene_type:complete